MKWFDLAYGNEKIKFMFNNQLSLEDVELKKLIFNDISSIRLYFIIKNIPKTIPEKWKKREFNALYLTLRCMGIYKSTLRGNSIGFTCSPIINKADDGVQITIDNNNGFYLSCVADIFHIESIEPYMDKRWK